MSTFLKTSLVSLVIGAFLTTQVIPRPGLILRGLGVRVAFAQDAVSNIKEALTSQDFRRAALGEGEAVSMIYEREGNIIRSKTTVTGFLNPQTGEVIRYIDATTSTKRWAFGIDGATGWHQYGVPDSFWTDRRYARVIFEVEVETTIKGTAPSRIIITDARPSKSLSLTGKANFKTAIAQIIGLSLTSLPAPKTQLPSGNPLEDNLQELKKLKQGMEERVAQNKAVTREQAGQLNELGKRFLSLKATIPEEQYTNARRAWAEVADYAVANKTPKPAPSKASLPPSESPSWLQEKDPYAPRPDRPKPTPTSSREALLNDLRQKALGWLKKGEKFGGLDSLLREEALRRDPTFFETPGAFDEIGEIRNGARQALIQERILEKNPNLIKTASDGSKQPNIEAIKSAAEKAAQKAYNESLSKGSSIAKESARRAASLVFDQAEGQLANFFGSEKMGELSEIYGEDFGKRRIESIVDKVAETKPSTSISQRGSKIYEGMKTGTGVGKSSGFINTDLFNPFAWLRAIGRAGGNAMRAVKNSLSRLTVRTPSLPTTPPPPSVPTPQVFHDPYRSGPSLRQAIGEILKSDASKTTALFLAVAFTLDVAKEAVEQESLSKGIASSGDKFLSPTSVALFAGIPTGLWVSQKVGTMLVDSGAKKVAQSATGTALKWAGTGLRWVGTAAGEVLTGIGAVLLVYQAGDLVVTIVEHQEKKEQQERAALIDIWLNNPLGQSIMAGLQREVVQELITQKIIRDLRIPPSAFLKEYRDMWGIPNAQPLYPVVPTTPQETNAWTTLAWQHAFIYNTDRSASFLKDMLEKPPLKGLVGVEEYPRQRRFEFVAHEYISKDALQRFHENAAQYKQDMMRELRDQWKMSMLEVARTAVQQDQQQQKLKDKCRSYGNGVQLDALLANLPPGDSQEGRTMLRNLLIAFKHDDVTAFQIPSALFDLMSSRPDPAMVELLDTPAEGYQPWYFMRRFLRAYTDILLQDEIMKKQCEEKNSSSSTNNDTPTSSSSADNTYKQEGTPSACPEQGQQMVAKLKELLKQDQDGADGYVKNWSPEQIELFISCAADDEELEEIMRSLLLQGQKFPCLDEGC